MDVSLYFDVLNQSTVVDNATLTHYCVAINRQIANDFAPVWGVGYGSSVQLRTKPLPSSHTARHVTVMVLDDSDTQGALGYHDVDEHNNPLAKVFAKTDQQYGLSLSVTLSHEILEMIGDMFVRDGVQVSTSTWAAREMCDPCEADRYGYEVDGVLVSDFLTPAYFVPGLPGPYDFKGYIRKPMTLLPGGYISLWSQSSGWTQQTAEAEPGTVSRVRTLGAQRHLQRQLSTLGMALLPVQDD